MNAQARFSCTAQEYQAFVNRFSFFKFSSWAVLIRHNKMLRDPIFFLIFLQFKYFSWLLSFNFFFKFVIIISLGRESCFSQDHMSTCRQHAVSTWLGEFACSTWTPRHVSRSFWSKCFNSIPNLFFPLQN